MTQEPAKTEQRNFETQNIDLENGEGIARLINAEDKKVAQAVEKVLPQIGRAIDEIARRLAAGGRLGYFGAGTSGRIGILDAAECPPTFSAPADMVQAFIAGGEAAVRHSVENAEDKPEFAREDVEKFSPGAGDAVVAVSASGNPAYGVEVLRLARERGALSVAVTSNPQAAMIPYADIVICTEVGAEAIAGSSRMKSGTAQKMVLNMISTGVMVRIGKTYENMMIDVSVSNDKLYDRACRIISTITGVDFKTAERYLEDSGRKVKTACVMVRKNCSRKEAEELLKQAGGVLRRIIHQEEKHEK